MRIKLQRLVFSEKSTIGILYVNETAFGFTLEDTRRSPCEKIPGQTCIPAGTYEVALSHSPRFKRAMPTLLNVPGFTHILIHWGNTPKDTAGCILLGSYYDFSLPNFIGHSKVLFEEFFCKLVEAEDNEEKIFIEIT